MSAERSKAKRRAQTPTLEPLRSRGSPALGPVSLDRPGLANHKSVPMMLNKVYHRLTHGKQVQEAVKKSEWTPSLSYILQDFEVLQLLIDFMTTLHNEENILFLNSVKVYQNYITTLMASCQQDESTLVEQGIINEGICSIFKTYILRNAPSQINLSSRCYKDIIRSCEEIDSYSLLRKKCMFRACCSEIFRLIDFSILNSFYDSPAFQSIARSRNIYSNTVLLDSQSRACVSSSCKSDCRYSLSSQSYVTGLHEWSIEITQVAPNDSLRQEFGVISIFDKHVHHDGKGISQIREFGARAVYGYYIDQGALHFYYASHNEDNSVRCIKDLSNMKIHRNPLQIGDIITIHINLDVGRIKFFLNHNQVRKAISIARNVAYFPVLLFSNGCKYKASS